MRKKKIKKLIDNKNKRKSIFEMHRFSVLDVIGRINSDLKGTLEGMSEVQLEEQVKWLKERVENHWDKSTIDMKEIEDDIRFLAKAVIKKWEENYIKDYETIRDLFNQVSSGKIDFEEETAEHHVETIICYSSKLYDELLRDDNGELAKEFRKIMRDNFNIEIATK